MTMSPGEKLNRHLEEQNGVCTDEKPSLGVLLRHSVLMKRTLRVRTSQKAKKLSLTQFQHKLYCNHQGNAGLCKGLKTPACCQGSESQRQT